MKYELGICSAGPHRPTLSNTLFVTFGTFPARHFFPNCRLSEHESVFFSLSSGVQKIDRVMCFYIGISCGCLGAVCAHEKNTHRGLRHKLPSSSLCCLGLSWLVWDGTFCRDRWTETGTDGERPWRGTRKRKNKYRLR